MAKSTLIIAYILLSFACSAQTGDASSYQKLKAEITERRTQLSEQYKSTDSVQRDSLLKVSYQYVFNTLINKIFPAWYGTPWAFHGYSQMPKQGTIACGYFITTTLRDVGFDIPRIKWAQMESERIIRNLTTDVKRFHSAPMSKIVDYINKKGNGLYIVGLDCHVGFIVKTDKTLQFVHANYYQPKTGVMTEPLVGWNPLDRSKYRVIGKILDNNMLHKWLTGYKYE